jgi:hypothetical protein
VNNCLYLLFELFRVEIRLRGPDGVEAKAAVGRAMGALLSHQSYSF